MQTGSGAAFLSDSAYLFDGKPSTLTRLRWTGGAQSTASFTGIQFSLTNSGDTSPADVPYGVVGILNTSLPDGLVVEVRKGATIGTLLGSSVMRENDNGTTSAWLIFVNEPSSSVPTDILFLNDSGGAVALAPSVEFTIGEIFVGNASKWRMKRNSTISFANPGKVRISSDGTNWPIMKASPENIQLNLAPIAQKQAFASANAAIDMKSLCKSIFNSDVVAVIPFENFDPALYGLPAQPYDPAIISKTAYLAQLTQPPTIRGNGQQYYDVAMSFQESI